MMIQVRKYNYWILFKRIQFFWMQKTSKKLFFLLVLIVLAQAQRVLLEPAALKPHMFTEQISGDITPLKPTKLGRSNLYPLPVESYQIDMRRAYQKFLPGNYPATEIFAYGGKVNGKFQYSYPGPAILAFKNTPTYIIWSNNINGTHILPVDRSPPFDMTADFYNQVPAVPHLHGLETEIGSDGEPMAFWTISGRKGSMYSTLKSQILKKNEAIFRYHNTKEGLFWFHDHAMGITRLNVYAGLVGLYEIIDPHLSEQEKNVLRIYGDLQRKYFGIADKSFNTDGSLHYPDKSESSSFTSWVPEFFGNTITVNGKVWPKVQLQAKKYRFVFLNGCQSRYIKISFENNGNKLDFDLFRRDSDYLQKAVRMKQHLLLIAGRVEIVIDLSRVTGEVLVKNSAVAPFPMGTPPDQFTSQVMKIVINGPRRNLAVDYTKKYPISFPVVADIQKLNIATPTFSSGIPANAFRQSLASSIIYSITQKMGLYTNANPNLFNNFDYLDLPQDNANKVISLGDFAGSNSNLDNFQSNINLIKNQISNQITSQINSQLNNQISNTNTNSILKILNQNIQSMSTQNPNDPTIKSWPYPKFPQGKPYFTTLIDVNNNRGELSGVMIDGVPLSAGCAGSVFRQDQVYDFYLINLTMDDHPIHIHLINFQLIGRFKFDTVKYLADYEKKNGKLTYGGYRKIPQQLDPRPYRTSIIESPSQEQKLFLDVIRVPAGQVTIARMKISNHEGNHFPFEVSGTQYVWHCHILEHEDNQMMRYYCIE